MFPILGHGHKKFARNSFPVIDSLVSYYKFDTDANDSVGSNHGTVNGATLVTGKINDGYSFDGIDDTITVPDNPSLDFTTEFSVSFWVNTSFSGTHFFIAKFDFGHDGYEFNDEGDGSMYFYIYHPEGITWSFVKQIGLINTGTWRHVVGTFNNGSMKLYIDGALNNTAVAAVTSANINASPLLFGNRNGFAPPMTGKLDEIGFWNREITAEEVSSLYNFGVGVQYNGKAIIFPNGDIINNVEAAFDFTNRSTYTLVDNEVTQVNDISGNGLHATSTIGSGGYYKPSLLNNYGGLVLENAKQMDIGTVSDFKFLSDGSPAMVFMIMKRNSDDTTPYLYLWNFSGGTVNGLYIGSTDPNDGGIVVYTRNIAGAGTLDNVVTAGGVMTNQAFHKILSVFRGLDVTGIDKEVFVDDFINSDVSADGLTATIDTGDSDQVLHIGGYPNVDMSILELYIIKNTGVDQAAINAQIADYTEILNRHCYLKYKSIYDSNTEKVIDAITVNLDAYDKELINTFITGCKEDGNWDEMDICGFLAAEETQGALLNWKDPAVHIPTEVGAGANLVFTPYKGYNSLDNGSYIDTNYEPDTEGVKFLIEDCSFGCYVLNDPIPNTYQIDIGLDTLSGVHATAIGTENGIYYGWVNGTDNPANVSQVNNIGLLSAKRDGGTVYLYKDGVQVASNAYASTLIPPGNMSLLRIAGLSSYRQQGFYFTGSKSIDHLKLKNRVTAYLNGLAQFDIDARKIFRAMTPYPSLRDRYLINDFVVGCKEDGNFDEFDICGFLAAHSKQAALLNWKDPASFIPTEVGAGANLIFTTNRGFNSLDSGSYIDTNYNPFSDGIKYLQDDASFGCYVLTDPVPNAYQTDIAIDYNGNVNMIGTESGIIYGWINGGDTPVSLSYSELLVGFWSIKRDGTTVTLYKDGVSVVSGDYASNGIIDNTFKLLFSAITNSFRQQAFFFAGSKNINHLLLKNRVVKFLTGKEALGVYDSSSETLFSAMVSEPNPTRKNIINHAILRLKSSLSLNGITSNWDEIDICGSLVAHSEQASLLNWKNSAIHIPTLSSPPPVFTVDGGWKGNGVNSYIDTNYNPATQGIKYTLTSASIGCYLLSDELGEYADIGHIGEAGLLGGLGDSNYVGYINNTDPGVNFIVDTPIGYNSITRNGDTIKLYKNGVEVATSEHAPDFIPNGNQYLLFGNSWAASIRTMGFFIEGSGQIDQAEVSDIIEELLTNIVEFDNDSKKIFNSMIPRPSLRDKFLINDFVVGCKEDGIWNKLSAFYCFAVHSQSAALINWKSPGSNNLVENGSIGFTVNRGFAGGSGKYLSTGLVPDSMSNYELDNGCVFAYSLTDIAESTCLVGVYDGLNQTLIYPEWSDEFAYWSLNSDTQSSPVGAGESIGLYSSVRTGSTQDLYKNGELLSTGSNPSTALISVLDFYILALNLQGTADQFANREIACAGFGLGTIDQLKLNNRITNYLIGKGAI